jgi:hypothetical protein
MADTPIGNPDGMIPADYLSVLLSVIHLIPKATYLLNFSIRRKKAGVPQTKNPDNPVNPAQSCLILIQGPLLKAPQNGYPLLEYSGQTEQLIPGQTELPQRLI